MISAGGLPPIGRSVGQRQLETENLSPAGRALYQAFETYIRHICHVDEEGRSHISKNNRKIRVVLPIETADGIRVQLVSWYSVDRDLLNIIEGFDTERCEMKQQNDDVNGGKKVKVWINWPRQPMVMDDDPEPRRVSLWSWLINEPKMVICGIVLTIFSASATTQLAQWKSLLAIVGVGGG